MKKIRVSVSAAILLAFGSQLADAAAFISFHGAVGPATFAEAGAAQTVELPFYSSSPGDYVGTATFSGGVILGGGSGYSGQYATIGGALGASARLTNPITITFSAPIDGRLISFPGFTAALPGDFELYDDAGHFEHGLGPFFGSGTVVHVKYLDDQAIYGWDFGINYLMIGNGAPAGVPEPASYLMEIAGLGLIGLALRRRANRPRRSNWRRSTGADFRHYWYS